MITKLNELASMEFHSSHDVNDRDEMRYSPNPLCYDWL